MELGIKNSTVIPDFLFCGGTCVSPQVPGLLKNTAVCTV